MKWLSNIPVLACLLVICSDTTTLPAYQDKTPMLIVLGVAQDAGYPQMGCEEQCCKAVSADPSLKRFVSSLALTDPLTKKWWLIDATPDIKEQLQLFQQVTHHEFKFLPDGIFLTHAHIGHYTGLMQLGLEAMNTTGVAVYVMPRMKRYLTENGPWSQLVSRHNIVLNEMMADSAVQLTPLIAIMPFLVPHRDEFSETAGFNILINSHKVIFIPDIDKWERWGRNIDSLVHQNDLAFLDGTFYKEGELKNRPMKEVPHPFVEESMQRFSGLSLVDKDKIWFIHFNHTNPLVREASPENKLLRNAGFHAAKQGKVFSMK